MGQNFNKRQVGVLGQSSSDTIAPAIPPTPTSIDKPPCGHDTGAYQQALLLALRTPFGAANSVPRGGQIRLNRK